MEIYPESDEGKLGEIEIDKNRKRKEKVAKD